VFECVDMHPYCACKCECLRIEKLVLYWRMYFITLKIVMLVKKGYVADMFVLVGICMKHVLMNNFVFVFI